MAKNNNLKDFVTDIADAIRAKKGTTDLINPQDFAEEIEGISGGGSGEGGSSWRYFDFSNITSTGTMTYAFKSILAMVGKFDMEGQKIIGPPATVVIEGG